MKNDTQEGRRYAEAMPHIHVHWEPQATIVSCTVCKTSITDYMHKNEQGRFAFLTAHRHKDVTSSKEK